METSENHVFKLLRCRKDGMPHLSERVESSLNWFSSTEFLLPGKIELLPHQCQKHQSPQQRYRFGARKKLYLVINFPCRRKLLRFFKDYGVSRGILLVSSQFHLPIEMKSSTPCG
ncbi:uncharacterized protein G2W53_022070 [Senna tora]|uniref:Uncharacterized protein n=1 Tax=Senna tora TaxID=362788 RepID=A0A834WLP6_9FABA|nr:uncharacterized protein G2W53_022070 [Senna tora]